MPAANKLLISKRKLTFAIFSIVLICSIVSGGITYVVAQSGIPATATFSGGIYSGAPTYTIWNASGTVMAKDANGAIQSAWSSATNALTTLQAAESAMTSGGEIYLKAGTYCIGTSSAVSGQTFLQGLSVTNSAITITGEGDSSILKLTVGNSRIISVYNGADNFRLYNLRLDGNNLNIHGGATSDALVAVEGGFGTVQGCTFINGAGADGFGTYNTGDWKVIDNRITTSQHGIAFVESSRNLASGNSVFSNQGVGILVAGGVDSGSFSNTLSANFVYSNGQDGIQLAYLAGHGVSWTTLNSNHVYSNGWSGLHIYGAVYTTSTNNQYYGNTGTGIQLDDDGTHASGDNSFIGDHSFGVSGVQQWGLQELMNSFNTVVSGGFYDANVVSGIHLINGNSHANLCWNATNWLT